MMKVLTHNIQQEREDQRDRSAQLFMWCIVVSMHQDDGIGASRLLRACNEMDAFEKKYQTAILYGSSKNATDAMSERILFEWAVPIGLALLSGGLVVLIIEINEWFGRKEDKRQERLKNEKRQPKT